MNKLACGDVKESFGQNIISKYNPECLQPRPVQPQGNNGNLMTGVFVQGSSNQQPLVTGPDNVFVFNINQWTWSTTANKYVQTVNLTGTFSVPVNFYETGLTTGTSQVNSFNDAYSKSLKENVLPQVKAQGIVDFQSTFLEKPSDLLYESPSQILQTSIKANSKFVPDNGVPEAYSSTFRILPTGAALQKFANGQSSSGMLVTGIPNQTVDYFLTGTMATGVNPSVSENSTLCASYPDSTCPGLNAKYPASNVYASLPSFDFYPEIADQQLRANQFNQLGLQTIDGSTSYGQPPWVFRPGLFLGTGPNNICSDQNGLFDQNLDMTVLGSEGLTYLQPIAGICNRRPDYDTCQNPCIRDPNSGELKPNPMQSQCRVIPNLADANSKECPTVCPQQCVEMWQPCPVGTGLLTTLYNTQNSSDVLSLQGPTLVDGTPNPQFPTDRNGTNVIIGPWPNPNRPYKECQAQGSSFCSLALSNLYQQNSGTPLCAANCPNGFINIDDFCSQPNNMSTAPCSGSIDTNQWNQSYVPLGPFFNGAQICVPSNPKIQNIVCDPNQFLNQQGLSGMSNGTTIQGCATQAINILTGTTCSEGTNTYVNELFSVEWCQNACPTGFIGTPSQSTCIADCNGAIWDSSEIFLQQWDQYDMFLTTGKCAPGLDCSMINTPGGCPVQSQKPLTSSDLVRSVQNHGLLDGSGKTITSKVLGKSLQKEIPFDDVDRNISRKKYKTLRSQIIDDQSKQSFNPKNATDPVNNTDLAVCPDGMEFLTYAQNGETPGKCQDICQPGFVPSRICRTTATTNPTISSQQDVTTCPEEDLIPVCTPLCPPNWDEDNRVPGVPNCTYRYPGLPQGQFPEDERLWKTCPEDGRQVVVDQSSTTVNKEIRTGGIPQGPAMCIRKSQQRLETCPINQQEDPNTQQCTQSCGELDIVIQRSDGPICVRACSTDGRQTQTQESLQDPNVDPKQVTRFCQRNAIQTGSGHDPNSIPLAQPAGNQSILFLVIPLIVIIGLGVLAQFAAPIRRASS